MSVRFTTVLILVIAALVSAAFAVGAESYQYCDPPDASYVAPNSECAKTMTNDDNVRPPGFTAFNPLNDQTCSGPKPVYSDECALAFSELYCMTYCMGSSTYSPIPTRDICDRIAKHCDPCINKLEALNPDACGPDAPFTYNATFPVPTAKGIYYRYETVLTSNSRYLPQNQGDGSQTGAATGSSYTAHVLGYTFLVAGLFCHLRT